MQDSNSLWSIDIPVQSSNPGKAKVQIVTDSNLLPRDLKTSMSAHKDNVKEKCKHKAYVKGGAKRPVQRQRKAYGVSSLVSLYPAMSNKGLCCQISNISSPTMSWHCWRIFGRNTTRRMTICFASQTSCTILPLLAFYMWLMFALNATRQIKCCMLLHHYWRNATGPGKTLDKYDDKKVKLFHYKNIKIEKLQGEILGVNRVE